MNTRFGVAPSRLGIFGAREGKSYTMVLPVPLGLIIFVAVYRSIPDICAPSFAFLATDSRWSGTRFVMEMVTLLLFLDHWAKLWAKLRRTPQNLSGVKTRCFFSDGRPFLMGWCGCKRSLGLFCMGTKRTAEQLIWMYLKA